MHAYSCIISYPHLGKEPSHLLISSLRTVPPTHQLSVSHTNCNHSNSFLELSVDCAECLLGTPSKICDFTYTSLLRGHETIVALTVLVPCPYILILPALLWLDLKWSIQVVCNSTSVEQTQFILLLNTYIVITCWVSTYILLILERLWVTATKRIVLTDFSQVLIHYSINVWCNLQLLQKLLYTGN